MSNDIPADMIQAVSVVPMLAPMMTEMACARVSRPALTNETVITVVAVEDCTEAVTTIPVNIPVKRLVVMAPNTWRSWGPAIFCRASLMVFIPNISSANEPRSLKMIQKDIVFSYLVDSLRRKDTDKFSHLRKKYFFLYKKCCLMKHLFYFLHFLNDFYDSFLRKKEAFAKICFEKTETCVL